MNNGSNSELKFSYEIFVSGLKIAIQLGCRPEERELPQAVQLDLAFEVLQDRPINELDQSVCYLTASQIAQQHASKQSWSLIENYLESLSECFFSKFTACSKIESRLSKFVVPGCDATGVKIVRYRAG